MFGLIKREENICDIAKELAGVIMTSYVVTALVFALAGVIEVIVSFYKSV